MPDATVGVTAVNARHRELLEVQAASTPPCFLRRYGALCFDVAESTNVSCAHWPTAALGRRLSYDVFTWLKWDLLHLALVAHGVRILTAEPGRMMLSKFFGALYDAGGEAARQGS